MKAAVYREYGGPEVLRYEDVPAPTPGPKEVRVRVRATSVNYGDLVARNFRDLPPEKFNMPGAMWLMARLYFGWRKPRNPILGSEFAGEVETVGNEVSRFQVGDEVFGYMGQRMGCAAEYLVIGEDGMIAPLPRGLSFEEAAVIPYGAVTALNLLDAAGLTAGERVLVNGASGSIGMAAVQIAVDRGARVTGVASTPRLELVQTLGAEAVVDYTTTDPLQTEAPYDLIFDIRGRLGFGRARAALTPTGRYMPVSFKTPRLVEMLLASFGSGPKVKIALAPERAGDLDRIREMAERGALKSQLSEVFPLEELAEAHRFVEAGRKVGGVGVRV